MFKLPPKKREELKRILEEEYGHGFTYEETEAIGMRLLDTLGLMISIRARTMESCPRDQSTQSIKIDPPHRLPAHLRIVSYIPESYYEYLMDELWGLLDCGG